MFELNADLSAESKGERSAPGHKLLVSLAL